MNRPAELNLTEVKRALIECAAIVGLRLADQHGGDNPAGTSPAQPGSDDNGSGPGDSAYGAAVRAAPDPLTIALAWIGARRSRDAVFGSDLFADPAWDMLLDLYVNHVRKKSVSVTSLCLASEVPTTTALRWIMVLEGGGLISRMADPDDRRRSFLLLTETGLEKMEQALRSASESDKRLGLGRLRSF